MRRAELHSEPDEHIPAEDFLRPATPPARFSGYLWHFGYILFILGAFMGLLFTMYVLGPILPRRELIAPLFEIFNIEMSWFFLSPVIGGSLGLLIFLFWAGRTRITVDDRGIEVEGAIRRTLIPWGDIEKVSICLKAGRRGPPFPLYTIHRSTVPYVFFVDLPGGARRRLCEAIEARGVETSNSFLAGASPLFGLLLFGLPAIILLVGL